MNKLNYNKTIFKANTDLVQMNSIQYSNEMSYKAVSYALESIPSEVISTQKICPHFT